MMTRKDEFSNIKRVIKNGSLREILEYVFEYYKYHILLAVLLLFIIGSIVYTRVTSKDLVLQGLFLNTFGSSEALSELEQDFIEVFPVDVSSEDIYFDTSLYYLPTSTDGMSTVAQESLQVIATKVASGDIDFIVADHVTLTDFVYSEYFSDLSYVLTAEQTEKYKSYFLYYDKTVIGKLNAIDFTAEVMPQIIFPDPLAPESMAEPVPVMIDITTCEKISMLYPNSTQKYAIAFVANGVNTENTIDFLDYLFK